MGAEAAIGMMAGGAIGDAFGQYQAGQYNAKLHDYNAEVAQMQARDAMARGREAEQRHRQSVRGLIGSQRASLAAQGVDVNDGSALDVQADTARLGELDALAIRNNAMRESWGYRVQAEDYSARASVARSEGTMRATSTLLTGAADTWLTGYKLGVFE